MKSITLLIFLSLFIIPSASFMAEGDNKPYYCEDDFSGPLTEEQILECQIYEAHQQEIAFEDYDRIYKENGIWHGVIDVELTDFESTRHTFNIGGINTARGVYYENQLFISFTRDIEQLTEITVNYDSYEYCSNETWLFGWRCSTTVEAQNSIEKTIYDDEPGLFASFIASLNYANVDSPIQPSDNSDYDYEVTFEGDPFVSPMESLHIISFKYVLTETEVSNVLADIQAQYDQELHLILIDDNLSLDEKQDALNDLNVEYADYDLVYGEEMESLCENEEQCNLENLPPPDDPPDYPFDEGFIAMVQDWLAGFGSMVLQYLIFFFLGGAIAFAVAAAIYDTIKTAGFSLLKVTYNFFYSAFKILSDVFIEGIKAIFSIFIPKR